MAGKPDYTPNEGTPVVHANFKGAIDSEYISPNLIPMDILKDCTNLTPFRKAGSLQQCAGHSEYFATYPTVPTGYKLIDQYSFQIDRDNTFVNMLFYSNGTKTKIYIDKWYNPGCATDDIPTYSNYNPNYEVGWNSVWVELTESLETTVMSTAGGVLEINGVTGISETDDYYNGWFLVNETRHLGDTTRFNFVTDFDGDAAKLTCLADIGTYAADDIIKLFRFPVLYNYRADTQQYQSQDLDFDPVPTSFISSGNEVRIACGKERRPLILSMIYKRRYFQGKNNAGISGAMGHDGFWLDFEQIPQSLETAVMTGFKGLTGQGGTTFYIDKDCVIQSSAPVTGSYVALTLRSGRMDLKFQGFGHSGLPGGDEIILVGKGREGITPAEDKITYSASFLGNGVRTIAFKRQSLPSGAAWTITDDEMEAGFITGNNPLKERFSITIHKGGGGFTTAGSGTVVTKTFVGSALLGAEAGDNDTAYNWFLGTRVYADDIDNTCVGDVTGTGLSRNTFVMNALIDGRDSVIFALGTVRPDNSGTVTGKTSGTGSGYGLKVFFNTWFSRRLTGIEYYTENLNNGKASPEDPTHPALDFLAVPDGASNLNALVSLQDKYPYFMWANTWMDETPLIINEIPLLAQYDIYEFAKGQNGQLPASIKDVTDETSGKNAYTYSTYGYWYIWFRDSNNGIIETGEGLKFVINTNRFIDQDTTMNYTKGTFVGQTNGRYFLIGCKNTVEQDIFENDDIIIPNNYAVGVSQYGSFLRNNGIFAGIGDKDIIRHISNYKGYLNIIKDNNVFGLDVNTEDEIQYRVIDTMLGRGTTYVDAICETPYGIIIPTIDGVWLSSPDGIVPIMNEGNSRLSLYKSLVSDSSSTFTAIYYSKYNEVMMFVGNTLDSGTVNTYVFVYNFQYKFWTVYKYPNIFVRKARTGTSKEPVLLISNYGDTARKCVYIDETKSTFLTASSSTGTTIYWTMQTHEMPYGERLKNINITWMTLCFDYQATTGANSLTVTPTRKRENIVAGDNFQNGVNDTAILVSLTNHSSELSTNQMKDIILVPDIANTMQIKIENAVSFTKFNLNSFYLWAQTQNRVLR